MDFGKAIWGIIGILAGSYGIYLFCKDMMDKRPSVVAEKNKIIRESIERDKILLTETAGEPEVKTDEFNDNVTILGSKFINMYPTKDLRVRQLSSLTNEDLALGVCDAFLRSSVDERTGQIRWHQIYYTTRGKDNLTYVQFRKLTRVEDNLKKNNKYEGETIGDRKLEYWNKSIGELTLRYHIIDIKDATLRSFEGPVKFKVSTDTVSFVLDLPIAHVRAQLECVDALLSDRVASKI